MLTLNKITITTPKGRVLMQDLSFSIQPGDKLAIIGEEGNGKSTLCKLIADPSQVYDTMIVEGQIINDLRIGYLPQNQAECNETAGDFLLRDSNGEIDYSLLPAVKRELNKLHVQLPEARFDEPLSRFSGGERVKIQLVRLMVNQPELLVLDEPTNDLDLATLEWFEEFIRQSEVPILFVSHDETLLQHCANRILHLEQTQRKTVPLWTLASVGYDDYVASRQDMIQRQTTLSNNQKAQYEKQLQTWRQIYQKVEHAQATITRQNPSGGRLLKKKIKNLKAVRDRLDNVEKIKKPDPEEAINLSFTNQPSIYGQRCLLDDTLDRLIIKDRILSVNLSLQIFGQARIGIIGNNGSGKTTYLNHLHQAAIQRGTNVVMMPQNYESLLPLNQSAVEFLTIAKTKEEHTKIMTYLGNLKFTPEEMNQPIERCSQGQKAKILFTHLVFSDADLLILDEPTRNLSPLTLPVIEAMLSEFHGAILSVSHDRRFLRNVMKTIYLFDENGLHLLINS